VKQQKIFAEYLDHMGSDITVVNAARASFGKESALERVCWYCGHAQAAPTWTDDACPECGADNSGSQPDDGMRLKAADADLIRFLATGFRKAEWADFLYSIEEAVTDPTLTSNEAENRLTTLLRAYKRKAQHWAPFAHPHVQIRISLPIFLARQFVKHQVGGVWSEESRRYISDEPGVWFPEAWHTRPDDIKQGAGEVLPVQAGITHIAERTVGQALSTYEAMLDMRVAPEEARCVLPLNMMTTVVWTGSLLFWSRVANQRVDSHAQLAAQELGKLIAGIVEPLFPVSWSNLCE